MHSSNLRHAPFFFLNLSFCRAHDEEEDEESDESDYLSDSSSDSSSESDSGSGSCTDRGDTDQENIGVAQKSKKTDSGSTEKQSLRDIEEQRKASKHSLLLEREKRFFQRILSHCRMKEKTKERRRLEEERRKKKINKRLSVIAAAQEEKRDAIVKAQASELGIPLDWSTYKCG